MEPFATVMNGQYDVGELFDNPKNGVYDIGEILQILIKMVYMGRVIYGLKRLWTAVEISSHLRSLQI